MPVAWPQNGHSKSANSSRVSGASTGPRMWSRPGSTGGSSTVGGAIGSPSNTAASRKIAPPAISAASAAASTPTLACSRSAGESNASSTISRETVKPIPDSAAPPSTWPGPTPRGKRPSPRRTAARLAPPTPISFPDREPGDHAPGDRRGNSFAQYTSAQINPGIGEREYRHDHVARPGVKARLQAFVR